jgi:hypothetical protein
MVGTRTIGALVYVFLCACAAFVMDDHRVMLYLTSFCHYCVYILTYYTRWPTGDRSKYEEFMMLVFGFKVLALVQLACISLALVFDAPPYSIPSSFVVSPALSPLLVLVAVALASYGYFVSAAATKALGIEGTYFGIELGFVKADYEFVQAWPYNAYPHPMITGQVFAMAALHFVVFSGLFSDVTATTNNALQNKNYYPLLLPIHCGLYLTHMVQEIFDFWKGEPWYKAKKA